MQQSRSRFVEEGKRNPVCISETAPECEPLHGKTESRVSLHSHNPGTTLDNNVDISYPNLVLKPVNEQASHEQESDNPFTPLLQ